MPTGSCEVQAEYPLRIGRPQVPFAAAPTDDFLAPLPMARPQRSRLLRNRDSVVGTTQWLSKARPQLPQQAPAHIRSCLSVPMSTMP